MRPRAAAKRRLRGDGAWRAQPFQPERLKAAREMRGLTKGELRIATRGLPVGSFEMGTRTPTFDEVMYLAIELQFPPAFFCRSDPMPPPPEGFSSLDLHLRPTKAKLQRKCHRCGRPASHWCDGPTKAAGKTCDRPMCARHRKRVGPNADFCETCAEYDAEPKLFP